MAKSQGRVPRLYIDDKLAAGADVVLPREASHYLVNVLRLGEGAEARLFNERDGEWRCDISNAHRKAAVVKPHECLRAASPPPDIDYLFAPLKSARLDYLAQKATEMGVRRIRPVITQHTVAERVKTDRLRANAIEAAEQCNMVWVPEVHEPVKLADALAALEPGRTLVFCDETAEMTSPVEALEAVNPGPLAGPLAVLLGPEGGFSDDERAMIRAVPGCVALSLGPRIMRADTAAVAVLALVQATLGDWR
jgi:16S rRNA (uracil1498-N3)-methyltransferase